MNILNIFNKTLLFSVALVSAQALIGMEQPLIKSEAQEQELVAQLAKAVQGRNFDRYFELLEKQPLGNQKWLCSINLDSKNYMRKSAIHFAAEQSNIDALKKLLAITGTVDINRSDFHGVTPLLLTAKNGTVTTLSFLLESGADPVSRNGDGTAFHWAAASNNIPAITFLKEWGLNINAVDSDGRTCLHTAALHGHVEAINALIAFGVEKDARSVRGENSLTETGATALHEAAGAGKTMAVLELIQVHQLDPNAQTQSGKTALHYAAENCGTYETIKALLENGALIDTCDQYGRSILHFAAKDNKPLMIAELVKNHTIDPNKVDNEGNTPLGLAINNLRCIAEFTLRCAGAQLSDEEKDRYSFTPSCLNELKTDVDKETRLEALAQKSLAPWDPNIRCYNNSTPLICAAKRGCHECALFLLNDPRTDPNIQDSQLKTALHHLIENWSPNGRMGPICARLLNLQRTNVGLKDNTGRAARQYLDKLILDGFKEWAISECEGLFNLRKMRVQLYLSLKNARCSEHCSEKVCSHRTRFPTDICLKIARMLTEESLPKPQ